MARLARFCPPGFPQHLIQRGNNRERCFIDDQDFACYAGWLKEYARSADVRVHAWVFMTNHVHLLVTPQGADGVSDMMQALGRRYVRYFNRRHGRSGTLWEGRFKSCLVQTSHYLLACYRYIELNPVRAQLVDKPCAYAWSSYRCNALGAEAELCSPHEEYLQLGRSNEKRLQAYQSLFKSLEHRVPIDDIRKAVNQGLALGDIQFKHDVEQAFGRRVTASKGGRPRVERTRAK